MRVEGEDVVFDSSKVEKHDFGRGNDTMPLGWHLKWGGLRVVFKIPGTARIKISR